MMTLFKFELIKLTKSVIYQIAMMVPIVFVLVLVAHFIWNVDQNILDQKLFYYEQIPYNNPNPYYHFSAQFLAGIFILIFPIQSILAMAINQQLDIKNQGWMIIKGTRLSIWKWHLQSWLANVVLLGTSQLVCLLVLLLLLFLLPTILSKIDFTGHTNPYISIAWIYGYGFLASLPMLTMHYWIAYLGGKISTSIIAVLLLIIFSYTVFHGTPYHFAFKPIATGLSLIEQNIIIGNEFRSGEFFSSWKWMDIIPVAVVTTIIIIHASTKRR